MFDSLSLKLEKAFQTLKGQGRITEINVAATIKLDSSAERYSDLPHLNWAGQGVDVLEKRGWDDLPERVMVASYSASRSLRTAAI